MNYYERHIGDYLKDTAHLSLLEHGVYTRLMDVYYTREIPFAAGEAVRLVGARTKEERAAVDSVLGEFFKEGRQVRCDREIERYQRKAEHNREVGKLGGRPRKAETQVEPTNNPSGFQTEPNTNPNLTLPVTSNQKPVTKEERKTSSSSSSAAPPTGKLLKFPPGFEAFWAVYPRKVGKDAAARSFAKRRFTADQLDSVLMAIASQRTWDAWTKDGGQFIPYPATWLNEGRWQDEQPSGGGALDRYAGSTI